MVYSVKKLFQIDIDNPFTSFLNVLLSFQHGLLSLSSYSKTITVGRERWFESKHYFLIERLLNYPIHYGWNPQLSDSISITRAASGR